jgi:Ser/Thr protein kinase RdoA (MazF antagonist)
MISKTQIDALTPVLPFYFCTVQQCEITQLGNGLINDTYLITSLSTQFVLQRINLHVFPQPELIAHNAELIHQHLINTNNKTQYPFISIGHIKNIQDESLTLINNECWRAIDYVPGTFTINSIENTQQAEQAAQAFATFTESLSKFDATTLSETIPNFHRIDTRLTQLELAIKNSPKNRIDNAQTYISFINEHHNFVKQVNDISEILPIRVTHNDTKINNLLFDNVTKQAKAVIDLDTCMPGFLMNDFGDLVRTTCSNMDENAQNINEMVVRMNFFRSIAKAYLDVFKNNITEHEKESLVIGSQLLPFMLAIRFLTDYLNGNVYFHTDYEHQNLDRAKNQFRLFSLLKGKNKELLDIVFQ